MEENKKIIEVNGIKMELDARTATIQSIDIFKVGDPVLLRVKEYDSFAMYEAVIIGFANFKTSPTIIAAYINNKCSSVELCKAYISSETTDHEIIRTEFGKNAFNSEHVRVKLQREIEKKEKELEEAKRSLSMFETYFEQLLSSIKDNEAKII